MYGGGYVTVNLGVLPFLGGGQRNNKIFDRLDYARKNRKPVLAFMRVVLDGVSRFGDEITNWVSYTYYAGGRLDIEPVYYLTVTYTNDKGEIQSKNYWVKREEN